ncbi:hypothetical protein L1987_25191 [Smallanthus sonchifolius]|uniref:Uncharacterized protein n=1 Tax=Smallanthus sonchifolius TaxID=185202 RepID=A0ACB9IP12_9ASTR|nr:hypothetical protein L1987_25191 [Smallanthus sonchifolius]
MVRFFDTLVAVVVVMMGVPDKWILVRAHGTVVRLPTQDDSGNSEVASLEGSVLKGFSLHQPLIVSSENYCFLLVDTWSLYIQYET